jgi:hypothetical protein
MKRQLQFHSPSEILEYLDKQKTSGLSVERFCTQEGLSVSTFWNWRKRYSATSKATAPVSFARLDIAPHSPLQCFEVVFDNKVLVRVPARFEVESLRMLISTLQ